MTTRHQSISMPRKPKRGRTCQCLQPRSPMSSADTRRTCASPARASSPRSAAGSAPRPRCGRRACGGRPGGAPPARRAPPRARPARAAAGRRAAGHARARMRCAARWSRTARRAPPRAGRPVEQRAPRGALVDGCGRQRDGQDSPAAADGLSSTSATRVSQSVSAAIHSASSTLIRGTPFTRSAHSDHALGRPGDAAPPGRPRRTGRRRAARASATTSWRRTAGALPPSRSPARASRSPSSPSPRSASSANTGTPVSAIAIVSASSTRFWLWKPPCPSARARSPRPACGRRRGRSRPGGRTRGRPTGPGPGACARPCRPCSGRPACAAAGCTSGGERVGRTRARRGRRRSSGNSSASSGSTQPSTARARARRHPSSRRACARSCASVRLPTFVVAHAARRGRRPWSGRRRRRRG